jgi:predicted O-linked N-acetylglucosamine transferase (SPINDLY family)
MPGHVHTQSLDVVNAEVFSRARNFYINRQFQEAEAALRQILVTDRQHVPALLLLSSIALQFKYNADALSLAEEAQSIAGQHDEIHTHIGVIRDEMGNTDLARLHFLAAVCLNPNSPAALLRLALSVSRRKLPKAAQAIVRRTFALSLIDVELWAKLAESQHSAGASNLAVEICQYILVFQPETLPLLDFIGLRLMEGAVHTSARKWLRRAAATLPGAGRFNYYGIACLMLGENQEAVDAFSKVLSYDPEYAHGHNNISNALSALGRTQEAKLHAAIAITLTPQAADSHVNLGLALYLDNEISQALPLCRRALKLNPTYSAARLNLANYLADAGQYEEAHSVLLHAIIEEPANSVAYVILGRTEQNFGNIDACLFAYERSVLINPNSAAAAQSQLLALQYSMKSSAEIFAYHCRNMDQVFPRNVPRPPHPENKIMRIGFVSGDFRMHPGGFFFLPLIENLDPKSVETFCYSSNGSIDSIGVRIQKAAQNWRSVANLKTLDIASIIKSDHLDLLIDLSGHTQGNLLAVFAERPAPVQASWLGYFDTTGCEFIDFVIMDPTMITNEQRKYFREDILLLSNGRLCYQPPEYKPDRRPSQALPLAQDRLITFGSFNNLAKLSDATVETWAQLLHLVPQSRLLLKWLTLQEPSQQDWLAARFARFGISRSRLIMRGKSPHAEMLAEYGDVDIALDPFPFNGGLTTAEALIMGVPVISLMGERPISRQGASILKSANCGDLVASTQQDYINLGVALASQSARLSEWHQTIAARLECSALLDGPGFAHQFLDLCISAVKAKRMSPNSNFSNRE